MVKKVIFWVVVLSLIASLWIHLRNSSGIQLKQMIGATATLGRGDLTIPITANGTIEPQERVTIKSEAGGKVAEILFEAGALVREGDLLIRLDPEDEQRQVDIFTKALRQAEINEQRAENKRYQSEHVDLPRTRALLDGTVAELEYLTWKYEREGDLKQEGRSHDDEYRRIEANYRKLKAQKAQIEADLERAKKNVGIAALDLQQAELAVEKAKDDLENAKKRLRETEIVAPSDGMVSKLFVKKGEVIASGSLSLTGGTPLATLADISAYYVRALVDEADIGRIREIAPVHARPGNPRNVPAVAEGTNGDPALEKGTKVKVTVESYPDEEFEGVIDLIEPEPEKGPVVISYVVRILLTSENSNDLPLGSQANVVFVSESVKDVVLVPNEAVRYVAGERGVYLQVDSAKVLDKKVPQFKTFRAGLDNGMDTQVIEGLEKGDVVYTKLPLDRMGREVTSDED